MNQNERNLRNQHQRQANSVATTKDSYGVIRAIPESIKYFIYPQYSLQLLPSFFSLCLQTEFGVKATCLLLCPKQLARICSAYREGTESEAGSLGPSTLPIYNQLCDLGTGI